MKFLNFVDLGFQTLVLGCVVLLSVALTFARNLETIAMVAMYGGIFLGPWQLVSSLVTVLSKGLYLRWRVIHLISSVVYLTIVSLFAAFFVHVDIEGILKIVLWTFGFGIPVVLAVFYYYITFKSLQLSWARSRIA